jgi:hypothetical protein
MTKFNKIPAGLWNELYEIGEHYNINIEIENCNEKLCINGLGLTENKARLSFIQEWENKSIDIFGIKVPIRWNGKVIYKKV